MFNLFSRFIGSSDKSVTTFAPPHVTTFVPQPQSSFHLYVGATEIKHIRSAAFSFKDGQPTLTLEVLPHPEFTLPGAGSADVVQETRVGRVCTRVKGSCDLSKLHAWADAATSVWAFTVMIPFLRNFEVITSLEL